MFYLNDLDILISRMLPPHCFNIYKKLEKHFCDLWRLDFQHSVIIKNYNLDILLYNIHIHML